MVFIPLSKLTHLPCLFMYSSHFEEYFKMLSLHFLLKTAMPIWSIWALQVRPSSLSASSSAGRPCVSQLNTLSTRFPRMVW